MSFDTTGRRTGATTRMVDAAIISFLTGKNVYIITGNTQTKQYIQHMIIHDERILNAHNCKISKTDICLRGSYIRIITGDNQCFNIKNARIYGMRDDCVFVDHRAPEQLFGMFLKKASEYE